MAYKQRKVHYQGDSIVISQSGTGFSVIANVSGYSKTYTADSLDSAQARAERLCYILDLKTDIIKIAKRIKGCSP